jgi:succinate-semialdehyde dehydrogenase/glutarate-semialdehyde dehydrogenase
LYSRSLTTTHRAAELIDAGMVGVNRTRVSLPELPFGDMKERGYGSEGGIEGLDAYLITKSVSVDYG